MARRVYRIGRIGHLFPAPYFERDIHARGRFGPDHAFRVAGDRLMLFQFPGQSIQAFLTVHTPGDFLDAFVFESLGQGRIIQMPQDDIRPFL